jgi:hypothetical protein
LPLAQPLSSKPVFVLNLEEDEEEEEEEEEESV